MLTDEKLDLAIKPLTQTFYAEVMAVEKASYPQPWTRAQLVEHCRPPRKVSGKVALLNNLVVAYGLIEYRPDESEVLKLAVEPQNRRRGIASALVASFKDSLCRSRRRRLMVAVHDTNLDAHLFWQQQEFRAIGVSQGHYHLAPPWGGEPMPQDAYIFEYSCR